MGRDKRMKSHTTHFDDCGCLRDIFKKQIKVLKRMIKRWKMTNNKTVFKQYKQFVLEGIREIETFLVTCK